MPLAVLNTEVGSAPRSGVAMRWRPRGLAFVLFLAAATGFGLAMMMYCKIDRLQRQTTSIGDELKGLRGELRTILGDIGVPMPVEGNSNAGTERLEPRAAADIQAAIAGIGDTPTAEMLATVLADLDEWVLKPDDEKKGTELKLLLAARLRLQVSKEVVVLQQDALGAPTGSQAAMAHGKAGQVLSLFPMSEEQAVLDEAKRLSAQQGEVANRIEIVRRQRYNQWASAQIGEAIDGYNLGSSYWSPKKENPKLINSLVWTMKEIDPALIEPAVAELYNYAIELTKGSISEKEKVELAKRLTDPSVRRKTLGDF